MVTFYIFYARGLGHPAHPFLLGLLEGWKTGLHHLNPTGMLHIAGFVTVCKAFLVKQEASCQAMEKALDGNFLAFLPFGYARNTSSWCGDAFFQK